MSNALKKSKHNLSAIPTAYEETTKIISGKVLGKDVSDRIDAMEQQRKLKDEEAILEILNEHSKGKNALVKMAEIRSNTFQEALGSLLSIRSTETFETMMLLFEYMERSKTYTLAKLTGTELLKFGQSKATNQERRHNKLKLLVKQSFVKIQVLDPEASIKNYKNKRTNGGLVYKFFDLLRIERITYSKINPDVIVKLEGVALLPEYIDHIHLVSRRYLPLESIRRVPEERGQGKSRHFLYKLCFKFAGNNKPAMRLTLDECMNLGKFYNKNDRNLRRKWRPIEKALLEGAQVGLIHYEWVFKSISGQDIEEGIEADLFGEIAGARYQADGKLVQEYYKYVDAVLIRRLYDLNSSIELPFALENREPTREGKAVKVQL